MDCGPKCKAFQKKIQEKIIVVLGYLEISLIKAKHDQQREIDKSDFVKIKNVCSSKDT